MNAQLVDIDDPRVVKALAHPIRMKILAILDEGTATPKDLAAELELPLENVSYHVRALKELGFIKLERTRQVRGAVAHHYKLAARPQIGNRVSDRIAHVQLVLDDHGVAEVEAILRDVEGRLEAVAKRARRRISDGEGQRLALQVYLFDEPPASRRPRRAPRRRAERSLSAT
jgi:DNA-binding transcriptional ArsR family regulator